MARVRTQKKSARGERACGRCGRAIEVGETYFVWSFRYGGKHVRCSEHPPTAGELTQSKMGPVYDAIAEAHNNLGEIEETKETIANVAEVAREVVEEYRAAAEAFNDSGPNAERADELEGWVDELEQFEPDGPEETEFDEDEYRTQALERVEEMEDLTFGDAMQELRNEWEEEHEEGIEEATTSAREMAEDLLNSCPM